MMFEVIFGTFSLGVIVRLAELPMVGERVTMTDDNVVGFFGAADEFFYGKELEVTSVPVFLEGGYYGCSLSVQL